MQTGSKDLESGNRFMLEQQLVPFAVLLIPQYKHKLNALFIPKNRAKMDFLRQSCHQTCKNLICWLNASENILSLLETGLFEPKFILKVTYVSVSLSALPQLMLTHPAR